MPWFKVGEVNNGNSPTVQKVNAGGKSICLIHHEGRYYATQLKCPHAGGDLSSGWCADGKLMCPLHRYNYDLQSGRGSPGQGDYINTYEVRVDNGEIFVKVEGWMHKLKQLFTDGT